MSRSRRSDGNATKSKILESAGRLIAQHGFAQVTNTAITQDADVDLASINYHFDGREGLYQEVLRLAHAHYIDEGYLQTLVDSPIDPKEKLRAFFQTFIEKITDEDQWYSKVFIREFFSASSHLHSFMENEGARKVRLICKIMSQVSGIDEEDPALLPCVLNTVAPCMLLIIASTNGPAPIRNIAHMDKTYLVNHLTTFTLGGLSTIALKTR